MQSPNIGKNELQTPRSQFTRELKKLFTSPLFITFMIASVGLLASLVLSFLVEQKYIFLPFKAMATKWENLSFCYDIFSADIWGNIFFAVVIATILVSVVVFAGFVVVWINAMSKNLGFGSKVGYYMIKIAKLLQLIFMIAVFTLVTVRVVVAINDVLGCHDTFKMAVRYWASIFLTIFVALYLIFFNAKAVIAVSVMKEAVVSFVPINTSIITAAGYFILALAAMIIQIYVGFNLTICLGCACSVLFGLHILQFRKTMQRIEAAQ